MNTIEYLRASNDIENHLLPHLGRILFRQDFRPYSVQAGFGISVEMISASFAYLFRRLELGRYLTYTTQIRDKIITFHFTIKD